MSKLLVMLVVFVSVGLPLDAQKSAAQSRDLGSKPAKAVLGQMVDTGGEVYSIKAYGAKGDGVADDTPAFNAALAAAMAKRGGIIYFPPGVYNISNPRVIGFKNSSHKLIDVECSGVTSTTLNIIGTGFVIDDGIAFPFKYGKFAGCSFDMTHASPNAAAIHVIDTSSWTFRDLSFLDNNAGNTHIGIELEIDHQWIERVFIEDSSFARLHAGICFYDKNNDGSSFGYNWITGAEFQIPSNAYGILVNGKSVVYSNYWTAKGDFEGKGSYFVYAEHGASLRYNDYDIRTEAPRFSNYVLCTDSSSGISGDGHVYAFGTLSDHTMACPSPGNRIAIGASFDEATNNTLSDWLGSGKGVSEYIITTSIDGTSGFGHVIGPNIGSPFVWMYYQPNNAFTVFTTPYPPSYNKLTPVADIDSRGNINLKGGVAIGSNPNSSYAANWTSGSHVPAGPCHNGSLYSNTSGKSGSTLYVCVSGAWVDVK